MYKCITRCLPKTRQKRLTLQYKKRVHFVARPPCNATTGNIKKEPCASGNLPGRKSLEGPPARER